MPRIEDRTGRSANFDRAQAAFVVRHVRRDDAFDGIGRVGRRIGQRHIDSTRQRRRAPGEVDNNAFSLSFDRHLQLDRLIETIVHAGELKTSLRKLLNGFARRPLGAGNDLVR